LAVPSADTSAQQGGGRERGTFVEVTPDADNIVRPEAGNPRNAVVFAVRNTDDARQTYRIRCLSDGGVSACRVQDSQVTVNAGETVYIPAWFQATGKGRIGLQAS